MKSKIMIADDPKELVGLYVRRGENYYKIKQAIAINDTFKIVTEHEQILVLKGQELKLYELEKHESYDTEKICVGKTIESVTHYGDFYHRGVQQSSDTITIRFTDGSEWDIRSRLLTEDYETFTGSTLKETFFTKEDTDEI